MQKGVDRKMKDKLIVSVVIPVYSDADGLNDTLVSLERQSVGRDCFEVIVCNDGALEQISVVCREHCVTEIPISPNRGSYFARNRGIERAQGKYIAFVDADIKVNPDWIRVGIREMEENDYVTGPVDIDASRAHTWTERYEVATALNMKYFFEESHFAPTANLWVRRSIFDENAMFDETLRSGGDSEFGQRIYAQGKYRMKYEEQLHVLHPPRNYRSLVKKTKRVAKGTIDLKRRKNPDYRPKKWYLYVKEVLFKPWKLRLKTECTVPEKIVFYFMNRWRFALHRYYQFSYERHRWDMGAQDE